MKTASLVLGIIGGVLAVIFALIFMLGGAFVNAGASVISEAGNEALGELSEQLEGLEVNGADVDLSTLSTGVGTVATWFYVIGALSIVGAIVGIVGGALVKKKNVVAGILMIVAAIPSFFTGLGIIASILFVIGGILALVSGKESAPAAA